MNTRTSLVSIAMCLAALSSAVACQPDARRAQVQPPGTANSATRGVGAARPVMLQTARQKSATSTTDAARRTTGVQEATVGATAGGGVDARHACTTAAECMNSCTHGAVSVAWYRANLPGGESCEDGCTSKGFEAPRCEERVCVAYRMGARVAGCTQQRAPVRAGVGPAHRCVRDADCITTCSLGAVNRAWHGWAAGSHAECKGGCTAKGWQPPRCQEGVCVAYYKGKREASCTQRAVVPLP